MKAFNVKTNGVLSFQNILIGSLGMLGIPDVTQYTSWQALYPPNMGWRSEVSDEYVGKFGFRDTKRNAAYATLAVTVHRPGSRALFLAPWPLR